MVGIDYTTNNVYANTQNYNKESHNSLPPVWQTRLTRIMSQYKDVNFIRVNGNDFIPNIDRDNFNNITVEQFKEIYNEL
jgi:hypothetical protein